VPDEYIARVFAVMSIAEHHTFQVLTKRHGRMRSLLQSDEFRMKVEVAVEHRGLLEATWQPLPTFSEILDDYFVPLLDHRWPLPNVWLGVSAENQQWADIRIPALLDTPAAVRFVSAEPLLGPIDLNYVPSGTRMDGGPRRDSVLVEACSDCGGWGGDPCGQFDGPHFVKRRGGIDWVIVGGESGHGARPMHPDWARSLRDQCQAAGVAFLFKQWGEFAPGIQDYGSRKGLVRRSWYPGELGDTTGNYEIVSRVGKKAAGRELDGRTWDQYPEAVTV
jgi:protein gp37